MKNRKILVPLDESPLSALTVKRLIAQKEKFSIPLTLLHVFDPDLISYRGFGQTPYWEIEEKAREKARQFISEQQQIFAEAGIQVETLVKEGHVIETICELADSDDYDILAFSRNPDSDLRNLLFGQIANSVIHQVKCPVLFV